MAIGKVESLSKVRVKSKANGIIKAVLVDVDSQFVEGQILAELDKGNLEAQATLDAEEANLQVAIASEARAPDRGGRRAEHPPGLPCGR